MILWWYKRDEHDDDDHDDGDHDDDCDTYFVTVRHDT